ncbi:MAG TPA: histidine kinase dimerization/phosphoacceptor domain -containing protein [Rhizomicrobium sp.]|nr:histidine kinase dimerization/phosphoacceptor domain -containing protein [Rhizomicrobium sp.]
MAERYKKEPVVELSPHGTVVEARLDTAQARVRQQHLLAELGVTALRGASFEQLLDETVRVTAEGLGVQFCKVLEHIPARHCFLVRAGVGWGEGVVGVATLGDELDSPAGYALRTRAPVISNHLENEQRFRTPEILQRFGIHRAMNVILQGDGRAFGVLEADSRSADEFDEADLAFLQGAANLLGMAIERDRHERNLKEVIERHQFLLREMNHRVKNSLAMVCSMLGLQAMHADSPLLAKQLNDAVHRIMAVARAYELLHQGEDVERLDIGRYIEATCRGLDGSLANVTIVIAADYEIEISTNDAISAALIVNELVTNSAKYAYPAGVGTIWVTLAQVGEDGFLISVRDEGVGVPDGFDARKKGGLGMRIVNAFTRQLKGNLEIRRGHPGTEFVVTVPHARRDGFAMPPPGAGAALR